MQDEVFNLHSELENKHWWFVSRRHILAPIIKNLMIGRADDLIVDVGCGTGGMVGNMTTDFNCMGVDVSELAISSAKKNYPAGQFVVGEIPGALEKTKRRTAVYLLMDVLEHVENDKQFLTDVVDQTEPGAHIVITVPARKVLWSQHDVMAHHFRRYEQGTFTPLWEELPVNPRLVTFFNSRLYPAIWIARQLGNALGKTLGSNDTDLSMPPQLVNMLLQSIFAGEKDRVYSLLDNPRASPYPVGVSLMAVLQKNH